MEQFDPFKFKSHEELSKEEQENFKPVEGGFVKESVISKESAEAQGLRINKRAEKEFNLYKNYGVKEYANLSQPPKELYEKFSQEFEFNEHQSEKMKEWALNLIKFWHDKIKPDIIFVTDTSGVPYGYVLKEAWSTAYTSESTPNFFKINPQAPAIKNGKLQELAQTEFVDLRKIKNESRIIVFDEGSAPYGDMDSIYQFSSKNNRLNEDGSVLRDEYDPHAPYAWTSRYKAAKALYKLLDEKNIINSIWVSSQAAQDFDKNNNGIDYIVDKHTKITTKKYRSSGSHENKEVEKYYRKGQLDEDIVGVPVKEPNDRFLALEFIKNLKKIGREAGEKLRESLTKE